MTTKTKPSKPKTAKPKSAARTTKPASTAEAVAAASVDHDHDSDDDIRKQIADLEKQRDDWKSKSNATRRRLQSKRKAMQQAAVDYQAADQHRKDCKSAFDKARVEYIREADAIADAVAAIGTLRLLNLELRRVNVQGITLELLVRLGYEMECLSTARCAELLGESVQAFRERGWVQSRIRDALAAALPRVAAGDSLEYDIEQILKDFE